MELKKLEKVEFYFIQTVNGNFFRRPIDGLKQDWEFLKFLNWIKVENVIDIENIEKLLQENISSKLIIKKIQFDNGQCIPEVEINNFIDKRLIKKENIINIIPISHGVELWYWG